jgi:hypothetical protein
MFDLLTILTLLAPVLIAALLCALAAVLRRCAGRVGDDATLAADERRALPAPQGVRADAPVVTRDRTQRRVA